MLEVCRPARLKVLLGAVQTTVFWAMASLMAAKGVNVIPL